MRDIVWQSSRFVLFHAERARNMRKKQNWISWKKKTFISNVLLLSDVFAVFTDSNCSALVRQFKIKKSLTYIGKQMEM